MLTSRARMGPRYARVWPRWSLSPGRAIRFGKQPEPCCHAQFRSDPSTVAWKPGSRVPPTHQIPAMVSDPSSGRCSPLAYILDIFETGTWFKYNLHNSVQTSRSSSLDRFTACWFRFPRLSGGPTPDVSPTVELRWAHSHGLSGGAWPAGEGSPDHGLLRAPLC